jgi:hypothetical protein
VATGYVLVMAVLGPVLARLVEPGPHGRLLADGTASSECLVHPGPARQDTVLDDGGSLHRLVRRARLTW